MNIHIGNDIQFSSSTCDLDERDHQFSFSAFVLFLLHFLSFFLLSLFFWGGGAFFIHSSFFFFALLSYLFLFCCCFFLPKKEEVCLTLFVFCSFSCVLVFSISV